MRDSLLDIGPLAFAEATFLDDDELLQVLLPHLLLNNAAVEPLQIQHKSRRLVGAQPSKATVERVLFSLTQVDASRVPYDLECCQWVSFLSEIE